MLPIPTILRAALVPAGLAIAMRGIRDLADEADERRAELAALDEAAEQRRAYLAGTGPEPAPLVDEPAAQEDFPPACPAPQLEAGNLSASSPRRRLRRALAAAVVGAAAGYLAGRAWRASAARAELAAAVNAARSAALVTMPPAPGSPADLAARLYPGGHEPARVPRCPCAGCAAGRERRAGIVDEHQGDEGSGDLNAAAELPRRRPYRCDECGWVAPAGPPTSRRLAMTLHQQSHTAGLPER